jgi:6-phosphogluconolactonase
MPAVQIASNLDDLTEQASSIILQSARQAVAARGAFHLCLAGGSTPRRIYRRLSEHGMLDRLTSGSLLLYWGDERCVPPDHPSSNFNMAFEELILPLIKSAGSLGFYRMQGEANPHQAANQYESLLRTHFSYPGQPAFDLAILGMGEDGHTASLFPGTQAVSVTSRWVAGHYVEKLNSWRITLTPSILNLARKVLIVVSGEEKATILGHVFTAPYMPQTLPVQTIKPISGDLVWLVDRSAAARLSGAISG